MSSSPLPDNICISSWQKCSSFSLRLNTDFSTSSKEWQELTVMLCEYVDPGAIDGDWKLYTDTRKTPAKDSETFDRNEVSVQHALPFLKTNVCEISVTWRKWMWSSVCESCSSSVFLFLRSSISCSSRFSCSSARLTSAFSWSLISCVTSERLLSMERIRSVKILSLSSTAACAECC